MYYSLGLSIVLIVLLIRRLMLNIYEDKVDKELMRLEHDNFEQAKENMIELNRRLEEIENANIHSDRKFSKR